jgi:hypothetical protein
VDRGSRAPRGGVPGLDSGAGLRHGRRLLPSLAASRPREASAVIVSGRASILQWPMAGRGLAGRRRLRGIQLGGGVWRRVGRGVPSLGELVPRRPAGPPPGAGSGVARRGRRRTVVPGASNRLESPDHRRAATAASTAVSTSTTAGHQGGPRPGRHLRRGRDDAGPPSPAAATRPRPPRRWRRALRQGYAPTAASTRATVDTAAHHRTAGERRAEGDDADQAQRDDAGSHLRPGGRHRSAARSGSADRPVSHVRVAASRRTSGRHRDGRGDDPLPGEPRRHDTQTGHRQAGTPRRWVPAYPVPLGPHG